VSHRWRRVTHHHHHWRPLYERAGDQRPLRG
jgi:hypothetical protein